MIATNSVRNGTHVGQAVRPTDLKEEVKRRIHIADLVGRDVALKKSGRTLKGPCPFHEETSPSFTVYPDQGTYHCYGCQSHGDIFSFLQQRDSITFPESLRRLAEEAGITASGATNGHSNGRATSGAYRNGAANDGTRPRPSRQAPTGTPAARYPIKDTAGHVVAIHERHDQPDGDKRFIWRQPDGAMGLAGRRTADLPLYGSEHLAEWGPDTPIVLCEGEKAARALLDVGIPAVGTVTGAAGTPGTAALAPLQDRLVVLWPDQDAAGHAHMQRVATPLQGIAREVRQFTWSEAPPKGDSADWVATHPDAAAHATLREALANAPQWQPPAPKTPASPAIEGASAPELLAMAFPEPRYAVPGVLPEGTVLLAGRPKTGKSLLAMGLAVAVATGGRALGQLAVDQGDVLYIALEDGKRRLQRRLRDLLGETPAPDQLSLYWEWPTSDHGGLALVDTWLGSHPEARLVVVDTLKRIRPTQRTNGNVYSEDYDALAPLNDLAQKHGVTVLVIHHTRKADADDVLDTISGSLGLSAAVDGVIVLKRSRGQADAVLAISSRDDDDRELAVRWDDLTTGWVLLGDAAEYQRSGARQTILDTLREAPEPLWPRDIAEVLGQPSGTIRKLLWTMVRDGEVTSDARGRYAPGPDHDGNGGNDGNGNGGNAGTGEGQTREHDPAAPPVGNGSNGAVPDGRAPTVTAVTAVTTPDQTEPTTPTAEVTEPRCAACQRRAIGVWRDGTRYCVVHRPKGGTP